MKIDRFFHASYTKFYKFSVWRHRHITPAGALVISAILLAGIFGFNPFKTSASQVLALACAVAVVSLAANSFPFRLTLGVSRILPEFTSVDQSLVYEIELTNLSDRPQKGLLLFEDIKDPRPSFNELLTHKEPFESHRNTWDRKTLYYRWIWLIQKRKKADFPVKKLPDLPPNKTIRVRINITPRHRGYIYFSGMTIARTDIIGLFNRLYRVKQYQKLLVLPRLFPIKPPELLSARHYHAGGISLASAIGNSNEFMSLRRYRPGDPLKNIHWKSFAKTGELVIKEFEDEYFVRHALILDTFFPWEDETRFEAAVSIASSYIRQMQVHESILDLMVTGSKFHCFSSGRGLSHVNKMLEILACVQPCTDSSITDLIPVLEKRIKQFSGSICIFLDWTADHADLTRLFHRAGVPVFIIIVTDNQKEMKNKIKQIKTDQIEIVEPGTIMETLGKK